jgi:hypothetical protein
MTRLVIEVMLDREVRIYTDADVELTIIDWQEVGEEAKDLRIYEHHDPIKAADKELLHKTTGLKQVYP